MACINLVNDTLEQYLSNNELLTELQKIHPDSVFSKILNFNEAQKKSIIENLSEDDLNQVRSIISAQIANIPDSDGNTLSKLSRDTYPTIEEYLNYIRNTENAKILQEIKDEFGDISQSMNTIDPATALDPAIRRNRVLLLSHLFSVVASAHLKEMKQNPRKFGLTAEDVEDYTNVDAIVNLGGIKPIFEKIYAQIKNKAATSTTAKAQWELLLNKHIYNDLILDVLPILEITEGIQVNLDVEEGTEDEDFGKEEAIKESWQLSFREVSSMSSLSKITRKFISNIMKYDNKGQIEKDDLGFSKRLDAEYVHVFLIDNLRNMVTSSDMFPMLEKAAKSNKWLLGVIEELKKPENERLKSAFYQDFRKDFVNYSVHTVKRRLDGTFAMESKPLNKPEGVYYLLEAWRNNYQSGNVLTETSIYREDLSWNAGNAKINYDIVTELIKRRNQKNPTQIMYEELQLETMPEDSSYNKLVALLESAGINIKEQVLQDFIREGYSRNKNSVHKILDDLQYIFKEVSKYNSDQIVDEEASSNINTIYKDLINTFSTRYASIAKELSTMDDSAIEDNIRVGGKNRYTHVSPNYCNKLVRLLNNSREISEEAYLKWLDEEFGYDPWFKTGEDWHNEFLEKLATNSSFRKAFNHKVVLTRDNKEYKQWDALETSLLLLTEYINDNNEQYCNISLPVLADAESAEFITGLKYKWGREYESQFSSSLVGGKEKVIELLTNVAYQEWSRIQRVRERVQNASIEEIANYDKRGLTFCFIEELNQKILKEDGTTENITYINKLDQLSQFGDIEGLMYFLRESIRTIYDRKFKEFYKQQVEIGVLDKKKDQKEQEKFIYLDNKIINTNEKAEQFLEEYFYNFSFNQSQIIQLFGTDLAFYKNLDDFYKRIKQLHSPALKLDTEATFNGVRVGTKTQRILHVKDIISISSIIDELNKILDGMVSQGKLSKYDKDIILSQYSKVNVADAQAYRSLDSYRKILIMSGRWDKVTDERAYLNIKNGNFTFKDFYTIWQAIKPFTYSQRPVYNGDTKIRSGIQHKNSEFPIIALYAAIVSPLAKSPQLQAMFEIMEEDNIDCIEFESTTKVGKQGVVNIHNEGKYAKGEVTIQGNTYDYNNFEELENIVRKKYLKGEINSVEKDAILQKHQFTTKDAIKKAFKEAIVKDADRGQVIHEVDFDDYGIQVENPEHIIDHFQLVGTQFRKLLPTDFDLKEGETVEIEGKHFTKEEFLKLYNAINTENIIEAFRQVDEVFSDPKQIEKILHQEIDSSPRYGRELKEACTIDPETGQFKIPLFDPIQSTRVQQLLNSVIRNRITAQKIRGGTCVQVSCFGMSEELNIKFKDEKGNIIDYDFYISKYHSGVYSEDAKVGYNVWKEQQLKNGNLSIAYMECYMPAYSKKLYEPLMKKDSKGRPYLDINELPEDLRKCVGYRVPTENKYSMAPLYIKGFLPQQNGSCIMLPKEITTIAGSDFDIDKMYLMLPEFKVKRIYDWKKAKKDFELENKFMESLNDIFTLSNFLEDVLDDAPIEFKEWFNEHKDKYRIKTFVEKVKYDYDKLPQEQSKEARNNAFIDMAFSVLTHKNTAYKLLKPGGFENLRSAAYKVTILKNANISDLYNYLVKKGYKKTNFKQSDTDFVIECVLENLSQDDTADLFDAFKPRQDALSPGTWVNIHQRNMMGASLVPIYANHNANHALIQFTDLELKTSSEEGGFGYEVTLNDKTKYSLHEVTVENNGVTKYVSHIVSEYLAAAVDNAKEALMGLLNLNLSTADTSAFLSRLGFDHLEVGLLMTQEAILEVTDYYNKNVLKGITIENAIDHVMGVYYDRVAGHGKDATKQNLTNTSLASCLLCHNEMRRKGSSSIMDPITYYKYQMSVLSKFKLINKGAQDLKEVTAVLRSDTKNGSVGPLIADNNSKINRAKKLMDNLHPKDGKENGFSLTVKNTDIIQEVNINQDEDSLRQDLLNTSLPYMNAFYNLGVASTSKFFKMYFPQASFLFDAIIEEIQQHTKTGRLDVATANSVYNELILYYLQHCNEFFNPNRIIDNSNGQIKKGTGRIPTGFSKEFDEDYYTLPIDQNNTKFGENVSFEGVDISGKSLWQATSLVLNNRPSGSKDYVTIYQDIVELWLKNNTEVLEKLQVETVGKVLYGKDTNQKMMNTAQAVFNVLKKLDAERAPKEFHAQDYYVNHFPIVFQQFKDRHPDLNLEFLNRVVYVKPYNGTPISTLQFKNVGKMTEALKQRYSQQWAYMATHSDPEVRQMARDLFLYNFFTAGYGYTGISFMHLVPNFLKTVLYDGDGYIKDLYRIFDYIGSENPNMQLFSGFSRLYMLNHLYNRKLVPILDIDQLLKSNYQGESFFENGKPKKLVKVDFSKDISAFNNLIKKIKRHRAGSEEITPRQYFCINHNHQDYYYELVGQGEDPNQFTFRRVLPKGFKNRVLEYTDTDSSILFMNQENYESNLGKRKKDGFYEEAGEPNIDYNSPMNNIPEGTDVFDFVYPVETDNGNDIMASITEEESSPYEKEAAQQLISNIFGEYMSQEESSKELNEYSPNEDWTDIDGDPIC